MLNYGHEYFCPLFQLLSLVSILYGGMTTLRQSDMKRIIAYSSVAHMGFGSYGLFSCNSEVGVPASIIIFLAHGLTSPGLFIVVGILYERYHTRILKYFGGLVINMPFLAFFTFFLTFSSVPVPLTINFIGEFMLFLSCFFFI